MPQPAEVSLITRGEGGMKEAEAAAAASAALVERTGASSLEPAVKPLRAHIARVRRDQEACRAALTEFRRTLRGQSMGHLAERLEHALFP